MKTMNESELAEKISNLQGKIERLETYNSNLQQRLHISNRSRLKLAQELGRISSKILESVLNNDSL